MPTWGLTTNQRRFEPWNLHPFLLKPSKVTTDPVHGEVYTTILEQAIIDTAPFQRLRRVRQLGTSHLVYPGATQSRFSHALGALRVAQDLLDGVTAQREGVHPAPDLIEQWERKGEDEVERKVARVIVLARLGALLHDLCHLPFGHSIEDDQRLLPAHDKGEARFENAWKVIGTSVRAQIDISATSSLNAAEAQKAVRSLDALFESDGELLNELKPLIISKGKGVKRQDKMKFPFVADLVGNTICADLLDYLRRDHQYTGLPVSLGTRFTTAFFITPADSGPYAKRLAISIIRDGHERTDVISELLKALRFRYELSERVLVHHTKLAADAMVGKMLELQAETIWLQRARPLIERMPDHADLLCEANLRPLKAAAKKHDKKGYKAIGRAVAADLEALLLEHGDDGLLESLTKAVVVKGETDDQIEARASELQSAASELAQRLLDRSLFKVGGRVGTHSAPAQTLFKRYGTARRRVALQDEAQRFAGIDMRRPRLLIWLPDPAMRLKQAKVLVDDGRHINTFVDYERVRSGRGSDIYDAHERLWATWVFIAPSVSAKQSEEALVYLARELGVCWERMKARFGSHAGDWVHRLALSRFTGRAPRDKALEEVLQGLLEEEPLAARGLDQKTATFQDHYDVISVFPAAQALSR